MNWGCFQDFRFNEITPKSNVKSVFGRGNVDCSQECGCLLAFCDTFAGGPTCNGEECGDDRKKWGILEREREADSATDELCDIQFAAHHFPGQVTAEVVGMSAAEAEMWEDYWVNGAEFSASDPPEDPEAQHQELQQAGRDIRLVESCCNGEKIGRTIFWRDLGQYRCSCLTPSTTSQTPRVEFTDASLSVGSEGGSLQRCAFIRPSPTGFRKDYVLSAESQYSLQISAGTGQTPPLDGVIREVWHAQKWRKDMDLDILSPMYDSGASHYDVNKVSRLCDGNFVIPIRWIKFCGEIYADSFSLAYNDKGEATITDTETILIQAKDLTEIYYDLEHSGSILKWAASAIEAGHPAHMPNPKCVVAAGRPNHWNGYMTHQNLPQEILQQEFHVHSLSTSPNASVAEQFVEFKAAVEETHTDPVEVQDELGGSTCFSIYVNTGLSDNPMQSEICSHIDGKGNCFCRKCKVGGTQKDKAANDGYHVLFEAGVPHSKAQILEELQKQVKLACAGVSKPMKASQTDTGVKDTYTQRTNQIVLPRRFQEELIQWTVDNRDKLYSPFLTMKGFNPAVDTPIEIPHTILLGIIKPTSSTSEGLLVDDQFYGSGRLPEDLKVAVTNVLDVFATIDPSKIITKIKYHLLVHADTDVVWFGPADRACYGGF
ncbi:hypothetical protein B0H14DRAFT_2649370 [Mycena olivaceomarginata]|nr:hypothetical protein B0H14DRAFT_2649370 [Mycena olivaceomarginata]